MMMIAYEHAQLVNLPSGRPNRYPSLPPTRAVSVSRRPSLSPPPRRRGPGGVGLLCGRQ